MSDVPEQRRPLLALRRLVAIAIVAAVAAIAYAAAPRVPLPRIVGSGSTWISIHLWWLHRLVPTPATPATSSLCLSSI